jgi:hypothetical protein
VFSSAALGKLQSANISGDSTGDELELISHFSFPQRKSDFEKKVIFRG